MPWIFRHFLRGKKWQINPTPLYFALSPTALNTLKLTVRTARTVINKIHNWSSKSTVTPLITGFLLTNIQIVVFFESDAETLFSVDFSPALGG